MVAKVMKRTYSSLGGRVRDTGVLVGGEGLKRVTGGVQEGCCEEGEMAALRCDVCVL